MRYIKTILLKISSLINSNKASKIVFYHDLFSDIRYTDMGTDINLFLKHLSIIKSYGYDIVTDITQKEHQIKVCLDDGFRGIWDTQKLLLENNIRPTVFIAVDLIGKEGYLNKSEILKLQEKGFIFQSHGWSHKNLTSFHGSALEKEIRGSKDYLTGMLNKPVDEICFPIGYFSKEVYDECIKSGYKTMYSSIPGNFHDKIIFDGIKTRNLIQYYTPTEVKYVLNGALEPFKIRYINRQFIK